jgi:hypothetical protein
VERRRDNATLEPTRGTRELMNIQARGYGVSLALVVAACGDDAGSGSGTISVSQGSDTETATSAGTSSTGTADASTTSATESDAGSSDSTGAGSGGDTTTGGGSTGPGGGSGSTDSGSDSGSTSGEESGTTSDDGDNDGDGIPNHDDPFPGDSDLPGTVAANLVYAHTAGTLFTMDAYAPYAVLEIGMFTFPDGGAGSMTDIAIDRWGVLYGITFDDLHVCDPASAACYYLAPLPDMSNGLTFVPPGTVDASDDSLIGIAISGNWRHMQLSGGMVNQVLLGSYGAGYSSSGDAFSIVDVGTYAAVDAAADVSDMIVEIDPADGSVLQEIGSVTGYTAVYGLAGWQGAIFAFDETGDVLLVDPTDGTWEVINDTTNAWWGAAVITQLPI